MNKIFFGIHTSLLLLLCSLLACCSQDEEEYAPTEKLVPLEFSAVIEGATRGDATEKTAFVDGDEITITIDGDDSGKSYMYVYDGKNWNPDGDNNRLLIGINETEVKITARYGYVDLSALGEYEKLKTTSLINSMVATAKVSYTKPNAKLEFKHDACKIIINVDGSDNKTCLVYVHDNTIRPDSTYPDRDIVINGTSDYGTSVRLTLYIPVTTNYIYCQVINYNETAKIYNYLIYPSSLEAGKTYTCNINVVP